MQNIANTLDKISDYILLYVVSTRKNPTLWYALQVRGVILKEKHRVLLEKYLM